MNKKPKSITFLSSWKVLYCRSLDNPCQAVSPLNSSLFRCLSSRLCCRVFVYVVFCGILISAHLLTHCVHNESFRHARCEWSHPQTSHLYRKDEWLGFSVLCRHLPAVCWNYTNWEPLWHFNDFIHESGLFGGNFLYFQTVMKHRISFTTVYDSD